MFFVDYCNKATCFKVKSSSQLLVTQHVALFAILEVFENAPDIESYTVATLIGSTLSYWTVDDLKRHSQMFVDSYAWRKLSKTALMQG